MNQSDQPRSGTREAARLEAESTEQQAMQHPSERAASQADTPVRTKMPKGDEKAGNRPGGPQPMAHLPEAAPSGTALKRP
jgi:hypothetical protein